MKHPISSPGGISRRSNKRMQLGMPRKQAIKSKRWNIEYFLLPFFSLFQNQRWLTLSLMDIGRWRSRNDGWMFPSEQVIITTKQNTWRNIMILLINKFLSILIINWNLAAIESIRQISDNWIFSFKLWCNIIDYALFIFASHMVYPRHLHKERNLL